MDLQREREREFPRSILRFPLLETTRSGRDLRVPKFPIVSPPFLPSPSTISSTSNRENRMWKLRFPRILLFTRGVTSPQPFVPTSGEMEIDVMGSWDLSFTDCHRFPFNQTLHERVVYPVGHDVLASLSQPRNNTLGEFANIVALLSDHLPFIVKKEQEREEREGGREERKRRGEKKRSGEITLEKLVSRFKLVQQFVRGGVPGGGK